MINVIKKIIMGNKKKFSNPAEKNSFALQKFDEAVEKLYNRQFYKARKTMKLYRNNINYDLFPENDNRAISNPKVSILIVAYNTNQLLLDCLNSLKNQTVDDFEIILIDNGGNEAVHERLEKFDVMHIKVPQNLILSEGRNIGAYFAKGGIIAFLDDDALVPDNYIESIIKAFDTYEISGFRGKVLPKSESENNKHVRHYDLGNIPIPSIINAEGNSAFKKSVYLIMDGMHPLLFGHEGWEISYKIAKKYGNESLIYWPETVIYHDYAATDNKLDKKNSRHFLMSSFIKKKNKNAGKYRREMKKYLENEQMKKEGEKLLKRKDGGV
ncbi:MAG: glycosyltransferase family 2 protein [Calditrichia bacterium]|nr:glycosyltransferase family 2 protein [Calditrichia bacterium]